MTDQSPIDRFTRRAGGGAGGEDGYRCSFCGTLADEARPLIASPGVSICRQCVALCNEILQKELKPEP